MRAHFGRFWVSMSIIASLSATAAVAADEVAKADYVAGPLVVLNDNGA